MHTRFRNRTEAGQRLATRLTEYSYRSDVLVLGLPRGGVPIAFEIAQSLHVPMDVCVVRKLGVPRQRELAMGAIAPNGVRVIHWDVVESLKISDNTIAAVEAQERQELARREQLYRSDRPWPTIAGRTLIVADDGLATGSTMRAAIALLKQMQPQAVIVAVPVAPPTTCKTLETEVDKVVCLYMPETMGAIGNCYEDFSQTTDDEVRHLLEVARVGRSPDSPGSPE